MVSPLGSFEIGEFVESQYRLFIIFLGVLVIAVIFVLLRYSRAGLIARGTMQNADMAAALGISPQHVYTVTFGGAVAGLAGVLYANWNSCVSPTVFDLGFSAQIIFWVVVGGLGTLVGPLVGAMALGFVTIELGTQHEVDVNLILGVILVVFVLAVPEGVTAQARALYARLMERVQGQAQA